MEQAILYYTIVSALRDVPFEVNHWIGPTWLESWICWNIASKSGFTNLQARPWKTSNLSVWACWHPVSRSLEHTSNDTQHQVIILLKTMINGSLLDKLVNNIFLFPFRHLWGRLLSPKTRRLVPFRFKSSPQIGSCCKTNQVEFNIVLCLHFVLLYDKLRFKHNFKVKLLI